MRIVHVSDCFAPRTGGIETQVQALALAQQAAGDDVHIVTATPGDAVHAGVDTVHGLPTYRVAMRLPGDLPVHPLTRRNVGALLSRLRPDVVHIHAGAVSPFAWGALRATRDARVPTLVTVHSMWGPLARTGFGAANALAKWNDWGARMSAVSAVAARAIERAVPATTPVLVVPNGIDAGIWRIPDDARVPPAGELRLVTVMRLAPRKRLLPLIDIVQRATEHGARLRLAVIGDGPMRARGERTAADKGLGESITFAGRLGRDAIKEVFARSDAFIQPSVRESFGLAALEARCAGLPVIARAQSGTVEFVDNGVEGLIAADDTEMAQAVVRLATDPALLDRMSAHNRTTTPAQDWHSVLATVREAYAAAGAR